jgi:hypothetical protein
MPLDCLKIHLSRFSYLEPAHLKLIGLDASVDQNYYNCLREIEKVFLFGND